MTRVQANVAAAEQQPLPAPASRVETGDAVETDLPGPRRFDYRAFVEANAQARGEVDAGRRSHELEPGCEIAAQVIERGLALTRAVLVHAAQVPGEMAVA